MITYQATKERFENTKKPPRSKKYNDNQRPLRRVSESHLMLQMDNHSYAYKINGIEVARYFEPNDQGEYEVAIRGLYGTYDISLMYKFTGIYSGRVLDTNTGDKVRVPLNPRFAEQRKDYSALLTFNSAHQLVVEKSWHADIYKMVSTNEDKSYRKELKQEADALVTLQMFKLPTLMANAKPDSDMGRAFGESRLSYGDRSSMRDAMRSLPLPMESESFIALFDRVAQDCFDMVASKRAYLADDNLLYRSQGWWANNHPTEAQAYQDKLVDLIQSITPEDFKKSLVSRLVSFAGLTQGTKAAPLPQFANTLPRKYVLVSS